MKKLFFLGALLAGFAGNSSAQLTANGNSGTSATVYTNGSPSDPIYIWCSDVLSTTQGSLTATTANGTAPYTFKWFYHNQGSSSWAPYSTEAGVLTSTINGLPSDGYRVEIRDANDVIVDCYIAWVWNLNTQVTASSTRSNCDQANLSSSVNTTGTFSYYNPPPPESLINANTEITVCFSANHTYVSDLAFYLVGPPSCGSPTIILSPNPGVLDPLDDVCNNGNNVSGLCFTTEAAGNLEVCGAAVPLSGTYDSYGSGTVIDWSGLIGCNAASGGWRVQIYDCIGADVGSLTNATITFANLTSVCGSPTEISYGSGSINSAINDNSCDAATASIFQVPLPIELTQPITVNAVTTTQWTAIPGMNIQNSTGLNATASDVPPNVTTVFIQTAMTLFDGTVCPADDTTSIYYELPIVSGGTDQEICKEETVTLSGSGAQTYEWNNGVSNGVAFSPAATQTYQVIGTNADGCKDTAYVLVTVNELPEIDGGADSKICFGTEITLSATGAVTYSWSNGEANGSSFEPPVGVHTYIVTGTDANGCENTDTIEVEVLEVPVSVIGTTDPLTGLPGLVVDFTNNSQFADSYYWNLGNGQTQTTTTTQGMTGVYNSPGIYTIVLVASNDVCEDESTLTVEIIYEPLIVHIPNVFTPDGDGTNDVFFIDVENGVSIDVVIVNRWGNKVAEISDFDEFWDGKAGNGETNEGTYFFTYTIVGKDGTTAEGQGFVELLK